MVGGAQPTVSNRCLPVPGGFRCKRSISLYGAKIFLPADLLSQQMSWSKKPSPPLVAKKEENLAKAQRRQVFQKHRDDHLLVALRLGETFFPENSASTSIPGSHFPRRSGIPLSLLYPPNLRQEFGCGFAALSHRLSPAGVTISFQ